MCKTGGYLVKKLIFMHNTSTLDEINNIINVNKVVFMHSLSNVFHNFIHSYFRLHKAQLSSYAQYPQQLLLLLLSIKLNIINKTNLNWGFIK